MRSYLLVLGGMVVVSGTAIRGQSDSAPPALPPTKLLSSAGVLRASATVDSVFVDKRSKEGSIGGGDFASYLIARLGVRPFPDSLRLEVTVDTSRIRIDGRIMDLPPDARALMGPLLAIVDPSTPLEAEVTPAPAGPGLARFRLRAVHLNGVAIPEFVLQNVLLEVGRRYPVLTASGRDLLIQIPVEGSLKLGSGLVRVLMP